MCYKKQMYDTLKMFAGLDTSDVELGKCNKPSIRYSALNSMLGIELGLDPRCSAQTTSWLKTLKVVPTAAMSDVRYE